MGKPKFDTALKGRAAEMQVMLDLIGRGWVVAGVVPECGPDIIAYHPSRPLHKYGVEVRKARNTRWQRWDFCRSASDYEGDRDIYAAVRDGEIRYTPIRRVGRRNLVLDMDKPLEVAKTIEQFRREHEQKQGIEPTCSQADPDGRPTTALSTRRCSGPEGDCLCIRQEPRYIQAEIWDAEGRGASGSGPGEGPRAAGGDLRDDT